MEIESQVCEWQQPEVTPGDYWSDPAWMMEDVAGAPCVLPAKRIKPTNGHAQLAGNGGFLIETRLAVADGPPEALEVSEINGRILRLEPEAQTVERVPRQQVAFKPLAMDERRRRARSADKSGEWGRANRHALYWVAGSGVLITALIVCAVAILPRVNRPNTILHRPGEMALVVEQVVDGEEAARMGRMLARHGEAVRVLSQVAGATTFEDILPLLREPESAQSPISVPTMFADSTISKKTTSWTSRELDGLIYGVLEGTLADFSEFRAYFIDRDGELLIDWNASTAHSSASFSELKEGRGDAHEIRGWLAPMDYYNLTYPENAYQSYRLVSPDEEQSVWIYAERGSEVNATLERHFYGGQILRGNPDDGKMTLRLSRGPDGAMPNQWLLVELLHKEWIAP